MNFIGVFWGNWIIFWFILYSLFKLRIFNRDKIIKGFSQYLRIWWLVLAYSTNFKKCIKLFVWKLYWCWWEISLPSILKHLFSPIFRYSKPHEVNGNFCRSRVFVLIFNQSIIDWLHFALYIHTNIMSSGNIHILQNFIQSE